MTNTSYASLSEKLQTSFQYGEHTVTLTTDYLAKQANASVLVQMGDTCVHVAISTAATADDVDFLPLMVTAARRHYSTGQISGGYIKRENTRGTEDETLLARLIDRSIRPLFPEGFKDEVQVYCYIMSVDPNVSPDVPAFLGVSAALAISDLPFYDIVSAVKIGYADQNYIGNPSDTQLETSDLNLFLAGKKSANNDGIIMIEASANELSENDALSAIPFGMSFMQSAFDGIERFQSTYQQKHPEHAKRAKPEPKSFAEIITQIEADAHQGYEAAYKIQQKQARSARVKETNKAIIEKYAEQIDSADIQTALDIIKKDWVRQFMFSHKLRIDGRQFDEIRPIEAETGVLPRVHGDCVFQRGETQTYVAATLAAVGKGENYENLSGEESKRDFMLYYNFPPYCVGEVGRMGPPKRREIGHGNLARRALLSVLPSQDHFPYTIRIVSETMESNGSSSMATVCGATLSMMAAGVPITKPVAGIAMGMLKSNDDVCVLSDILGDEDHLGDMDLKVAGTNDGITALQMDIKIDGITHDMLVNALEQARAGRIHILGEMHKSLADVQPISPLAPRMINFNIKTDKIREVIGKGGAVIREIIERFGVEIDITDDGSVTISAVDGQAGEDCKKHILDLVSELEVGQIFEGKITKILDFGAVVDLGANKDGFLHISQISQERVNNIHDYLSMGQEVKVKVSEIDRNNKVRLSMKEFESEGS
ncbi:MAG: polyribonucleotide nucleotidyltransferase [Pseudomonadota bacterium]|nr:polyribonucleotide nucleotidyltransferase [Pseudomonadota bacterium]